MEETKEARIAGKLENLEEVLLPRWEEALKKQSTCCREHLLKAYTLAVQANYVVKSFRHEFLVTKELDTFEQKVDEFVASIQQDTEDRTVIVEPKVEVTFVTLPMGKA